MSRDYNPAPSEMRLYLHIGIHKTGSTAVQHFLAANQEPLADQGILYPRSGRPARKAISHGHHLLIPEIKRAGEVRTNAWEALHSELDAAEQEVAVLSSENFDLLVAEEELSALCSELEGFEVKVIAYLRRQDEFLHSYYCLDVLFHHESRDFTEYRRSPKTDPDYLRLLGRWEEAFGRDALIVRRYERPALVDGDVVADVCAHIGVDTAGLAPPTNRRPLNRTYSRNVINCVKWAHQAGLPEDDVAALRNLFFRVYRDRSSETDYLSPAERSSLLDEFAESNAEVARRYLGRDDGLLFENLETGDDAAWHERYDGPLADLAISIADAQQALRGRRHRSSMTRAAPAQRAKRTGQRRA